MDPTLATAAVGRASCAATAPLVASTQDCADDRRPASGLSSRLRPPPGRLVGRADCAAPRTLVGRAGCDNRVETRTRRPWRSRHARSARCSTTELAPSAHRALDSSSRLRSTAPSFVEHVRPAPRPRSSSRLRSNRVETRTRRPWRSRHARSASLLDHRTRLSARALDSSSSGLVEQARARPSSHVRAAPQRLVGRAGCAATVSRPRTRRPWRSRHARSAPLLDHRLASSARARGRPLPMREPPSHVSDDDVLAAVREHWDPGRDRGRSTCRSASAPTTGPSPRDGARRLFVTLDGLEPRHSAASLEATYAATAALADLPRLRARPPAHARGSAHCRPRRRRAQRHAVARRRVRTRPLRDRAEAEGTAAMLSRLHAVAAPAGTPALAAAGRRRYAAELALALGRPWDTGPYGERARRRPGASGSATSAGG